MSPETKVRREDLRFPKKQQVFDVFSTFFWHHNQNKIYLHKLSIFCWRDFRYFISLPNLITKSSASNYRTKIFRWVETGRMRGRWNRRSPIVPWKGIHVQLMHLFKSSALSLAFSFVFLQSVFYCSPINKNARNSWGEVGHFNTPSDSCHAAL